MPSTTLRSALDALAHAFADGVLLAIRSASLEELHAGSGFAGRRAVGRPRAQVARGNGQPDPLEAPPGRRARGGRLARRSPEDIAQALAQVVALVKKSDAGMRSEEIRKALGIDARAMPRVLKMGLHTKKLKSKGQKRATKYLAA